MTENMLDPTDFAERLELSFPDEPAHAAIDDDLRVARRRLRRHRVTSAVGGVGVAAVVAIALLVVPGVLPHPAPELQAASAPLTDADVVRDCVDTNDHVVSGGSLSDELTREQVQALMGDARLMTRADTGTETLATVRAGDKRTWMECTLSRRDPALKVINIVYPTDVTMPRATVDGVEAYEMRAENDPRLAGTATGNAPQVNVDCSGDLPEETPERDQADAACKTIRVTWNDRRPVDVARVTIVTPDGQRVDADVKDGYLSFAWTGPMTDEVSRL